MVEAILIKLSLGYVCKIHRTVTYVFISTLAKSQKASLQPATLRKPKNYHNNPWHSLCRLAQPSHRLRFPQERNPSSVNKNDVRLKISTFNTCGVVELLLIEYLQFHRWLFTLKSFELDTKWKMAPLRGWKKINPIPLSDWKPPLAPHGVW